MSIAETKYGNAKAKPVEIKAIRVFQNCGGVIEDFHGGSQLRSKLETLEKHLKPGEDLLVILWVEKAMVDGKSPSKELKQGAKETGQNVQEKPEPVHEGRRVGYCRLMSLRTLLKSADQIYQKGLDRWKHTVVPTRDNIHLEVMQRLFDRHPEVSFR